MNLRRKKLLVGRTLNVGLDRIIFARPEEIKEAITKQDIRDLLESKAILIRQERGKKVKIKKLRRGPGKIKKKVNKRKQTYVKLTRKLREYIRQLLMQERISNEEYRKLRKEIKSKIFRSKSHLKEMLTQEKK